MAESPDKLLRRKTPDDDLPPSFRANDESSILMSPGEKNKVKQTS